VAKAAGTAGDSAAAAGGQLAFGFGEERARGVAANRTRERQDSCVSDPARKDLHDLVDALPPGEVQAARRFLEYLLEASDPLACLPDDERARLHASLQSAEGEIAAGQAVPAEAVIRELRAAR
jgi:hypothetical protein